MSSYKNKILNKIVAVTYKIQITKSFLHAIYIYMNLTYEFNETYMNLMAR